MAEMLETSLDRVPVAAFTSAREADGRAAEPSGTFWRGFKLGSPLALDVDGGGAVTPISALSCRRPVMPERSLAKLRERGRIKWQ